MYYCRGGADTLQVFLISSKLRSNEARGCFESTSNIGRGMFQRVSLCHVNTNYIQDMHDSNPLVRALALRTMSYIYVKEFVHATLSLTKNLLRDADPYVRKTAAFCVAKLYDHDRNLVESSDLIDRLNSMLRDDNPTVVASALASLMDIWERSDAIKLTIDYGNASKMVQILPDCSEYVGLDFLSSDIVTDLSTDGVKHISSRL